MGLSMPVVEWNLFTGLEVVVVQKLPFQGGVERFGDPRCPSLSTALDPVGYQRTVRVTRRSRRWFGRAFAFLAVRQGWSGDRVYSVDGDSCQSSLPARWTDAAETDAFVTMSTRPVGFPVHRPGRTG
jgi:hypothetical protein